MKGSRQTNSVKLHHITQVILPIEDKIQELIDGQIGDKGRLEHILAMTKAGRELYHSDKDYLESLLSQMEKSAKPSPEPEKDNSGTNSIQTAPNGDNSMQEHPNFCGKCGSKIQELTNYCPKCGAQIKQQNDPKHSDNRQTTHSQTNARLQRPPEWKSEGVTLVLTIVLGIFGFGGIGHIYLGKLLRGIVILIIGIILLVITIVSMGVGLIILIPFAIWVILDARKLCREYNAYYEQHGRPPDW